MSRSERWLAWLAICAGLAVDPPAGPPAAEREGGRGIQVFRFPVEKAVLDYRRSLRKERLGLRGYRAPVLANAGRLRPTARPAAEAPALLREAADVVARSLARDGLPATLVQALAVLRELPLPEDAAGRSEILWSVGIPVDLLAFFSPNGHGEGESADMVQDILDRLSAGGEVESLQGEYRSAGFVFAKSDPSFRVAAETGEARFGLLRLQLPLDRDARSAGDGNAVDILRQLIDAFPSADFLVSISDVHVRGFLALAGDWPLSRAGQLKLCVEALPVAQWAQDNGKAGYLTDADGGPSRHATLVPRYASVGEESTKFSPGETFLMDSLAALGHPVIQSPLLFQGGNLLPVRDLSSGECILLIGEAEVYRNTSLGLTEAQAIEAMRIEFGVDRCVVLPAVSFHLDSELSIRADGAGLMALVNDTMAGVRVVIEQGAEAFRVHRHLTDAEADAAHALIRQGKHLDVANLLGSRTMSLVDGRGVFPASLASAFAADAPDAGPANLQRFLLALDLLTSLSLSVEQLPGDPELRAFAEAIRRQEADRRAMHASLAELGWRVVGVPGLPSPDRGICYLNGLHEPDRYIMPVYGGLFAPLDKAATEVIQGAIGPDISIVPIRSRESQIAFGAVHCSVGAYPVPAR